MRKAADKNCAEFGGWPSGHPCAISELRGMLGSWEIVDENCAVFRRRSRLINRVTDWKNCAIFEGSAVTGSGCLFGMSAHFLQSAEAGMLGNFCVMFGGVSAGVTARSNSSVDQLEA